MFEQIRIRGMAYLMKTLIKHRMFSLSRFSGFEGHLSKLRLERFIAYGMFVYLQELDQSIVEFMRKVIGTVLIYAYTGPGQRLWEEDYGYVGKVFKYFNTG